MDNRQFPEQETSGILPQDPAETSPERGPMEETPATEDIPFSEPQIPEETDMPGADREPQDSPAAFSGDEPADGEASREIPAGRGSAFMDRIPDVDEDYPPEPQSDVPGHELLETPQMGQEISPDDHAMDFHGMLGHGEPEPPFDLDILNDPEFAVPEETEPSDDDVNDQEYRDNGGDFDAMLDAPAPENQVPVHHRPTRKGRPKRKKGEGLLGIPHILVTVVWLALILAIGVTLGRMLWICAADVLAFGREEKAVTVTIYESDTIEDITDKLYSAGLIRYKSLFQLYASFSHAEEDIQPGIYDLNTRYDYHALVNFMSPSSSREVVSLTIPEGYTCRQIFDLLEEYKICTIVDIAAYAASGDLDDYWFLEDVERGTQYCLEGFLFPDTYEFYKNSTPKEALEKMLDNFDVRFSEEMREQIGSLNEHISAMMRNDGRSEEYIAEHQFTVREVTIVASLIEKETSSNEESPAIASVIYNRLFSWGSTPSYLNIDASIIYALDGKTSLTSEDLQVDSPYNTYTNTGLTPTPISNPGLASLKAALEPASTNYYFYVLNPSTGTHQFSTTQEEHEAWRAQFNAESGNG